MAVVPRALQEVPSVKRLVKKASKQCVFKDVPRRRDVGGAFLF